MTATLSPPGSPGRLTPSDLAGEPRRHRKEALVRSIFMVAAGMSLLVTVAIIVSLFAEGWLFITSFEWDSLWVNRWNPRSDQFGMPTLIIGSLIVTGVAISFAAPIGLGAAVYLSEYASPKVRNTLKPILEVLAGIPSVVLGYFALVWIAPNVVANIGGNPGGSLMAAGLGVGVLTIPLIASISEDAMAAVPQSLREASSGLGARKLTTTVRVVLPAAVSGLIAAFIVAVSRALGETMVVFIAGGAADTANFTANPFDGGLTMTAAMASQATGTDQVRGSGLTYTSLFFVGIVLFFITFGLNVIANRFVRRVREIY